MVTPSTVQADEQCDAREPDLRAFSNGKITGSGPVITDVTSMLNLCVENWLLEDVGNCLLFLVPTRIGIAADLFSRLLHVIIEPVAWLPIPAFDFLIAQPSQLGTSG